MPISASQLYNHLTCPHRVTMDRHANPADRDEPNAFVELLWERGSLFERETISKLEDSFTDLSALSGDEKEHATRAAMARGDALIYSGRLRVDELLGEPDLLRREGTNEKGRATYVAIDIKSGAAEEEAVEDDPESGKPKKTYGVQLALYTDILIRLDVSAGRYGFVRDVHGNEVRYDFDALLGKRSLETMWSVYLNARNEVAAALERAGATLAAASSACKMCVWRSACLHDLQQSRDLTLLPELGRARRDALATEFPTLEDLAGANVERYIDGGKTQFARVGPDMLRTFRARARLAIASDPRPYLKKELHWPPAATELFFDIETDPLRDFCYLHGFVVRERADNSSEKFVAFFVDDLTAAAERDAFAKAWSFIARHPGVAIYIYSKYERTIYRKLAEKYTDVCSRAEVDALFDLKTTIDLYYGVVKPHTEWPTMDHSIKSVATCLGFEWRDSHPSGAASIQWFHQYMQTRSIADKQRILDYNEDDCRAMRVLVDGIRKLDLRRDG